MKPIDRLSEMFNADGTKNREVTWYILLEVKINKHKKQINIVVMNLNSTNMFLGYNWLVKQHSEVNWNIGTIQFILVLCPIVS